MEQKIDIRRRYPIQDGLFTVEIQLDELNELYDELDPSPFRKKDLDDQVAKFMVSSFREIGRYSNTQIKIYLLEEMITSSEDINRAIDCIHLFFEFEKEEERKKLKQILKVGLKSLVIGLTFLLIAVFVSYQSSLTNTEFLNHFLKEGVLLLGWVSMWHPINIFLYEWWPYLDLMKVYDHLSRVPVKIINR